VISKLRSYKKDIVHLFIIYFGDVHFHIFNQENYKATRINFFGRVVEVVIHVFYVSRIAMIDTFKKMNKIENLDYINDLLIQLYEFKREKARARRNKNNRLKAHQPDPNHPKKHPFFNIMKWMTIISVSGLAIGAVLIKFLFFR
jgi:hypothetical protein